jgi:HD-GYP domain-containing protein (c-di-GMP phosphodiesterase class II)
MDGGGYPHGLTGVSTPLLARVIAVADAYDAMTSDRPYRQGLTDQEAVRRLREGAGTQWDAELVDAFCSLNAARIAEVRTSSGDRQIRSKFDAIGASTVELSGCLVKPHMP